MYGKGCSAVLPSYTELPEKYFNTYGNTSQFMVTLS